jgi:hypothetical protein
MPAVYTPYPPRKPYTCNVIFCCLFKHKYTFMRGVVLRSTFSDGLPKNILFGHQIDPIKPFFFRHMSSCATTCSCSMQPCVQPFVFNQSGLDSRGHPSQFANCLLECASGNLLPERSLPGFGLYMLLISSSSRLC